jgi:uncharacterized protein YraI
MRSRVAVLISILAGVSLFSALPVEAAITHTTANLNLRTGPGRHPSSDQGDHSGGSAD